MRKSQATRPSKECKPFFIWQRSAGTQAAFFRVDVSRPLIVRSRPDLIPALRKHDHSSSSGGFCSRHRNRRIATICYICYIVLMIRRITQRELRNDSGAVLREVQAGHTLIVTRNGVPVAELRPVSPRRFVPRAVLVSGVGIAPTIDRHRFRLDLDAVVDQSIGG